MNKLTLLVLIFAITATNLFAQQVIEFRALSEPYNVLTWEDVKTILAEEWQGGIFIAEIHSDITIIGENAFIGNKHLYKINTNNVETIKNSAFCLSGLKEIELPLVTRVEDEAFRFINNILVVKFGARFTEQTEIFFGEAVFTEGIPLGIDLILSEYVIPKPDLEKKLWQDFYAPDGLILPNGDTLWDPYEWRSITIFSDIVEEIDDEYIYDIGNNTYRIDDNILELKLYDITGKLVKNFSNEKVIDLNSFPSSLYFLQYSDDKKTKIKKLIKK